MQQEASRLPKHPINTIHTGKERKGRKTECRSLHKAVLWAKGWYLSASSQPISFPWSVFPGSITEYAIRLGCEEQSEKPRESNVAQKKAKLLCKSKSSCGELCFESWAEGQGRPPQILSRWIHSQGEEARMHFLVSLHRNSAGQHLQASFTGHDAFILYKTCKVSPLSIFLFVPWRHSNHCSSEVMHFYTCALLLSPSTSYLPILS